MSTPLLEISPHLRKRRLKSAAFRFVCMGVTWCSVLLLAVLLFHVASKGMAWLDLQFLTSYASRFPEKAGLKPAIFGTVWLIGLTCLFSIPIGVAAAVYLEEYAKKNRLNEFIEVNIANLAGVPSIVYGILGLAVFVRFLGFGGSILSGACTMSLLILPVIIMASREAIRAVPMSIRQAAFALGATKWQTTRHHVLPAALPGILTGVILATSRAVGETAPMIMVGAATLMLYTPDGPMSEFVTLPQQIYYWAGESKQEFHELAAAGIVVLLCVLLLMNASAIVIRNMSQKRGA